MGRGMPRLYNKCATLINPKMNARRKLLLQGGKGGVRSRHAATQ